MENCIPGADGKFILPGFNVSCPSTLFD